MLRSIKYPILALVSASVIAVGCDESKDSNPMSAEPTTANVRVIHTSYNAPAVDVRVNDQNVISNLKYGESSGYAELNSGSNNVKVSPAGALIPVVIDADVVLGENKEYTIFAANELSSIEPIVAEDNRTPVNGKVKIRFVHKAPDAPAVDIRLNDGNGAAVFSNAAFRDVTDYITVDGGSYVFAVTPANSSSEVVVFDPVAVEAGNVYTVVAHGTLDANDMYPFAVRVFVDNGDGNGFVDLTAFGTARVMVTHASPDAPGVDLLVDNAVAGSNLGFPMSTGYLPVTAGTRNIKVNVTGTSATVIEADLALTKDMNYSVFAVDSVSMISALVLEDDLTAPAAGNAHVRFIHLSPDAPAVDITTTDGNIVFGNNAFKDYTAFTPLAAGTYDLQVRVQGTETVVLNLNGIMLEDGKIYTVFAKGFAGGSEAQALGAEIIVNN